MDIKHKHVAARASQAFSGLLSELGKQVQQRQQLDLRAASRQKGLLQRFAALIKSIFEQPSDISLANSAVRELYAKRICTARSIKSIESLTAKMTPKTAVTAYLHAVSIYGREPFVALLKQNAVSEGTQQNIRMALDISFNLSQVRARRANLRTANEAMAPLRIMLQHYAYNMENFATMYEISKAQLAKVYDAKALTQGLELSVLELSLADALPAQVIDKRVRTAEGEQLIADYLAQRSEQNLLATAGKIPALEVDKAPNEIQPMRTYIQDDGPIPNK